MEVKVVVSKMAIKEDIITKNDLDRNKASQTQCLDKEDTIMHKLARFPMYENAKKLFLLQTSLALVSLQSTFGWLDNIAYAFISK